MIGKRARKNNSRMTKCYFCKGKVAQRKISVDFRWGEKLKVIEDVPAAVCQQCGEKYLHSAVYKSLEELAISRAKPASRLSVDVVRFKKTA
jgi:YgiT-type zinc finger domain-containing protein